MNDAKRFPAEVEQILRRAGWFPDRRNGLSCVTISSDLPMFPSALVVLEEFGGLVWGETAKGIDIARSKVAIDPGLVDLPRKRVEAASAALGIRVYPLGEEADMPTIVVDERGRVYLLLDELLPTAPTFDKAILSWAFGKKRPEAELISAGMERVRVPF